MMRQGKTGMSEILCCLCGPSNVFGVNCWVASREGRTSVKRKNILCITYDSLLEIVQSFD